ncbi:MAG: peptidylprolyl isomerase [Clostridia bacterium]|nr:peptidylprolyl isomerase [Clostridia bacterium]
MAKNMMKKTICLAIAVASACASLATMTACETSKPKVEMVLEFNEKTYTLEYNLNRNLTPTTARHFLELVDGKFYNGLCIHDYQTAAWYTGVYEYKEDTNSLVYRSYLDAVKKLEEKGLFTPTVWNDEQKTDPTYTLYGEFSKNSFRVENGSVRNSFGALTMRYTSKGDFADTLVWGQRSDGNGVSSKEYGYNSATSMFSINVSSVTSGFNEYCTFAELEEDSVEVLQSLQSAIEEYVESHVDAEDFTLQTEATINEEDAYAHADVAYFSTPVEPIKIASMKVTKW